MTPDIVVADANRARSPLRKYFEWDDTKAARLHRRSQAAYLLRIVVVVSADGEPDFEPVRAFVAVQDDDKGPCVFTHISDAMADEDLQEQVLARAKRELSSWRRRYRDLESFAAVFHAIDSLVVA